MVQCLEILPKKIYFTERALRHKDSLLGQGLSLPFLCKVRCWPHSQKGRKKPESTVLCLPLPWLALSSLIRSSRLTRTSPTGAMTRWWLEYFIISLQDKHVQGYLPPFLPFINHFLGNKWRFEILYFKVSGHYHTHTYCLLSSQTFPPPSTLARRSYNFSNL